jgi:hypothetical protein
LNELHNIYTRPLPFLRVMSRTAAPELGNIACSVSAPIEFVVSVARCQDAKHVFCITNEAFMADTFFKKPEFYQRFESIERVEEMMQGKAAFLIVKAAATADEVERPILGSIYLTWTVSDDAIPAVVGTFGCASVGKMFEKRGLGRLLVAGAESHLLAQALAHAPSSIASPTAATAATETSAAPAPAATATATASSTSSPAPSTPSTAETSAAAAPAPAATAEILAATAATAEISAATVTTVPAVSVVMECGVINVRTDLFPWYERQGYSVVRDALDDSPVKKDSAEVAMIKLPSCGDVCCHLMRKTLQ